jgi:hypothetical protein
VNCTEPSPSVSVPLVVYYYKSSATHVKSFTGLVTDFLDGSLAPFAINFSLLKMRLFFTRKFHVIRHWTQILDSSERCWHARHCDVLDCTVMDWTVLDCPGLYCTVLYCTVLYCTVLYCTVLYCTVLYCTVLYCTVLYCTVLYCTVLYCTVLYCTVLLHSLIMAGKDGEPLTVLRFLGKLLSLPTKTRLGV